MIQIEQVNVPALLEENTYLKKQVAYYQETTGQLEREYTYLRGKIEEIEQEQEEIIADQVSRECAHLRNKVEQLDTRLTWRSNVDRISGDVLTPSRKATIIRLRTYLKEHTTCADSEGYQQVFLENLTGEQEIGTIGDNINYVSTVHPQDKSGQYRLDIPAVIPLFEKRLIWVQDGPKKWHQEAFIKALPLLEDPPLWTYACTSIIQHGGLRPGAGRPKKCERCGHDLEEKNTVTRKQRSTHCPKCGIDHVYPEEIVSEPLTPTDPLPPDGGGLKNQLDFSISEEDEPSENQLDLDYLDTRGQVDFSTSEEETSENQVDCVPPAQENADTGGVSPFDAIPAELRAYAHWLPWRYGETPGTNGKLPKIPRDAQGKGIDYTDPLNWMTFEQVIALYLSQAGRFDGIGYVFSKDDPFTGVDLDHCRDIATGAISERAQDINRLMRTYGEISPSGTGLKWIARGEVEHSGKDGDLEMYDHKRFFAITGNRLPEALLKAEYRQAQLTRLNAPMVEKRAKKAVTPPCVSAPCSVSEQVVLEKCRNGKKGAWFTTLWNGDFRGYPSQSEADLALCEELAYRSDRDRAMVDRLFRQSGLYRPKWERANYREWTLDRALGESIAS